MTSDDDIVMTSQPFTMMRPVSDLTLHIGGKQVTYAPSRVKPEDMPYLLHLMVALVVQPHIGPVDCESFVNEHNLWHCFRERA